MFSQGFIVKAESRGMRMTTFKHHRIIICTVVALACTAMSPAFAQQMHYLGIAATNTETVFESEVKGAGETVAAQWQLASSQTVASSFFSRVTTASITQAIQSAAGRMDLEKDVLFLLVSSHGAPRGLGIALAGGGLMTARELRSALDAAQIKNRVVVVSACYSGQFIGPLAGPNTVVITAANATNPSFGCSNQRTYTYFGDALFNYGIAQKGRDLKTAFAVAKTTVTRWERRDGERPSNPQINVGAKIGAVLAGVK
jgi:Peptidase C13 family